MRYFIRYALIFFVNLSVFSQNTGLQEVKGRVINQFTGEPIPLCNITIESSTIGTASNELGEFIINIDSLPVTLFFSHLNHVKQKVEISNTSEIVVELIPLTTQLNEVIVSSNKKDKYAIELAKKAYLKALQKSAKSSYGKAFYRQKSKNGESYSEFSEIIYDIKYNASKIEDWNILEGRYALKTGGVHNKNFTLLSRLLTTVQPATDELVFPMHPEFESYYNLRIIDYIEAENEKIAVILFKPKENSMVPTFEAEVYVNTKTFNILKISGALLRDDLKLVRLAEKRSHWQNYLLTYEIAYLQENINDRTTIDYIKIDNTFDYYKNDSLKFKVDTKSNLTFFEHYRPTSRKKLGGQFYSKRSDWQQLNKIGYNKQFWEENPIVRRTGIEEGVISSFEKNNSFGTIFLNSQDQISLFQSDLADDPIIKELGSKFNLYNNANPIEKIYLHTDKDLFSNGEYLWYSAYTVLGPFHHYSLASKVLHIDLIGPNNRVISSQTNEIVEGRSAGSIKLPNNISTGNYQLRAYTSWMRNFDHEFFFTKPIRILGNNNNQTETPNAEKIDLQFFPEGGHMVNGLTSLIAFKAIGNDGEERKIRGIIIDSKDQTVAQINTIENGAGYFHLKPLIEESYKAQLSDGTEYALPEILNQGYTMTINNLSTKSIAVKVQASKNLRENPFYIVGHVNNKKYYQAKFSFGDDSSVSLEVPKNWVPSGVMTLTLLDEDLKPWCERIAFINNQEELVITTKTNPLEFEKRAKITLDVHVTDMRGNPISTNLSLAVTDASQVFKNKESDNILTYLLLQSDLKGHIVNPGKYFINQNRATLHGLDLVLLTHGWRKFPWIEVDKTSNNPKEFPFSKGLDISGIAKGVSGKPMTNATLNVIAKSNENLEMFSTITSPEGKFSIPNFNFKDTTEIAFNALNKRKTPIDVQITLDHNKVVLPLPKFKGKQTVKDTEEIRQYSNYSATRKNMRLIYEFRNATELEEVVLTEKIKKNNTAALPSRYGQKPDATLFTEDTRESGLNLIDYIRRFAGVTVSGSLPNYFVSIRQEGTPLWVLNGVPLDKGAPQGIGVEESLNSALVPAQVATMDISNVERVELLKGPSATVWGMQGANGVFLVYTKRGESVTPDSVLSPSFSIFGHAAKRVFYSPKYDSKIDGQDAPDYRATIYWNPSFTTDRNGNARLEFFNSDNAKKLQISIEGLNSEGIPGTYLKTLGVID